MKTPGFLLSLKRINSLDVRRLGGLFCLLSLICFSSPTVARSFEGLQVEVAAGDHPRHQTPVAVVLELPANLADVRAVSLVGPDGTQLTGQLAQLGLLQTAPETHADHVLRELHFILPHLDAGQSVRFRLEASSTESPEAFHWKDVEGQFAELHLGDRPVLRYMYRALDESSPENRFLTYKVFHHLFDPSGNNLLTNGPDGQHPYEFDNILFPHHRGIFYGFNRCSYEGVPKADVWHCQGDDHQSHAGHLQQDVGPIVGRHRVAIGWHGKGKQEFAREHRELAAYNMSGGHLIEFTSRLESQVGPVKLDGDPQHAGFQFRAHNEVAADTKGQTYYVRADGTGKPGETRNWPQNSAEADLPWKGLSFVRGGQRYTVAYLDLPSNPKESRFSERDYGRFGSYFEYELDEQRPLEVRYRLWVQKGEMASDEIAALRRDFAHPPVVKVVRDDADNTPPEGFHALFNGRDLTGWKGLFGNPKTRMAMSAEELKAAQEVADEKMRAHWSVKDGVIVFDGKGDNLCTARDYGDFEMYVDWKIEAGGDSGIYLRGSPQVQIWDTKHEPYFRLGAHKGSGSLWNNQEHENQALVHADRPVGQWNTLWIKMVGEHVRIKLNGKLVTDTVMENYWERDKPIYSTGQIELQNHGNPLYFKNIYIREL